MPGFLPGLPQILQTASAKSYMFDFQYPAKLQTALTKLSPTTEISNANSLITQLSFSHFIELLKADSDEKGQFYEEQTIQNNWPVKALKRAMDSLLYERTGLSKNRAAALQDFEKENNLLPEAVFRNTYLLEFLGLEEKAPFTESDLEERIIINL